MSVLHLERPFPGPYRLYTSPMSGDRQLTHGLTKNLQDKLTLIPNPNGSPGKEKVGETVEEEEGEVVGEVSGGMEVIGRVTAEEELGRARKAAGERRRRSRERERERVPLAVPATSDVHTAKWKGLGQGSGQKEGA